MEAEEEFQAKQRSSPLSEAETRILKAVSSSSINSTEDGKEIWILKSLYFNKYEMDIF